MSALLSSIFLALAVMSVVAWSRSRLLFLGILLGATPTVLFLASVVNPSGLEISAALCLWCSGLVLALENLDHPPLGLVAVMTASAAVLILDRPLSPLWVALTLMILTLLAGPRATLRLLRRRHIQVAGIAIAIAAAVAIGWLILYPPTELRVGQEIAAGTTNGQIFLTYLGQTGGWFQQIVGVFGWLNVYSPLLTYLVWYIGVAFLVLLAMIASHRRQLAILALLIVLVILVPVLLGYEEARSLGLDFVQARYIMPFTIGTPLVAAALVDRSEVIAYVQARLTIVFCSALAIASFMAFAENLRRYTVGVTGPIDYLHGSWSPPLGASVISIIYLIVTVIFTGFFGYLAIVGGRRSDFGKQVPASLVETNLGLESD